MKAIWKYVIEIIDKQAVEMPHGAEMLSFQYQSGKP